MGIGELIKKFNNGDNNALSEIYDTCAKSIFFYGYMITKNSFDAEIVLKSTMIEISKEAYKYNEKKDPLVWILSITGKYALGIFEKTANMSNINTPEYLKLIDDNANAMPENVVNDLNQLSVEERQVLALKGHLKIRNKDITKITGFSKKFINKNYRDNPNIEDIDKLRIPEKTNILIHCEEPNVEKYKTVIKKRVIIKFATVAAALIIGVVGIFTLPEIITKNIHYYKAVKYFKENNLITENFTKDEVIEAYDDLVLGDFSADITKEIINESIINEGVVGKLHILPSNANTEDIFNILRLEDEFVEEKTSYKLGESDKVYLEKYEYGKLQWKTTIIEGELGIWGYAMYKEWGDYIVVYMQTEAEDSLKEVYVALVDKDGNKLWCNRIECEFSSNFEAIQLNEKSISIFTSYRKEYIQYTEIDVKGNIIVNNIQFHDYMAIVNLEKIENGYKIFYTHLNHNYVKEIDLQGKELSHKEITRDEIKDFNWQDSVMFKGKLYYSGYSMSEMEEVDLEFKPFQPITDEEDIEVLTNAYRKRFCAKLLVYNDETDTFEEIYKIYGARGRNLSVDINGNLNWSVEGIKEYTWEGGSGASFSGESLIYKYVFDNKERIIEKIETYDKKWF